MNSLCEKISELGSPQQSERQFIGIWVPKFLKKHYLDYRAYIRVLEHLAKEKFLNHTHEACIDVANLPIARLYFDLDCIRCKENQTHPQQSSTERFLVLGDLIDKLKTIGMDVVLSQLTVALKGRNSGCGMHVTINVLADFAARDQLYLHMEGQILAGTHFCDNPSNVLLPGGRGYSQILNLKTRTSHELTLQEAIQDANVVIISEQLKTTEHFSVRIQSTAADGGECICWADAAGNSLGQVYLVTGSNIMTKTRSMLWERIKALCTVDQEETVVYLKYKLAQIPVRWFRYSNIIIAKSIVSEFFIREKGNHPYNQLRQIQIKEGCSDEDGNIVEMIETEDEEDLMDFNDIDFEQLCDNSLSTLDDGEIKKESKLIKEVTRWLPYTNEEFEWQQRYKINGAIGAPILSKPLAARIMALNGKLRTWWIETGAELLKTTQDLIKYLSNQAISKKSGKKRKVEVEPHRGEERPSTSSPTLSCNELIQFALHENSITATVSFIVRICGASVEEACLLLMILSPNRTPEAHFVLVRLATVNEQMLNFLTKCWRGCDLFYLYINRKTQLTALTILNRTLEITKDGNILVVEPKLRNLVCNYIINCSTTGNKIFLFDGNQIILTTHKLLANVPMERTKLMACDAAYSYRCHFQKIYNPFIRIFEATGPSLMEVTWRCYATPLPLLTPSLPIHEMALSVMLKVPAFISHLQVTALYQTLVSPLWPIYETYPNAQEYYVHSNQTIDVFESSAFQTLLEDLTAVINRHATTTQAAMFSHNFENHLQEFSLLRTLFLTTVSIMYTINTQHHVVYETPSVLITKLFGSDYWQCIGTQFKCTWNQRDNKVIKESRLSQFGAVTFENSNSPLEDTTEEMDPHNCENEQYIAIARRLLKIADNRVEMIAGINECLNVADTRTNVTNLIAPVIDRPLHIKEESYVDSVSETLALFSNIDADILLYNKEEILETIDTTYPDVNIYVLLIISWFIRMGDSHRLRNVHIFKFINKHRKQLYQELCQLAHKLVPHGKLECASSDDLVVEFEKFDASVEVVTPTIYNNTFNIDLLIERNMPDLANDRYVDFKRQMINSVDPTIRHSVISALMELLRSANYNLDLFIEFVRLVAYCEYPGNPLRIGYNIYGSSGSGKTSLLNELSKTFNTTSTANLTSRQFKEGTTGDNDPNARTIGFNFICHMNEENVVLVSKFKSYIDVGTLVTRDCYATEVQELPIKAKVVFCTNEPVQVENATDDGFHQRYYPIPLTYAFREYEEGLDRLIRHKLDTPPPPKCLGGQLLMNLHTSGRTVNFSEKLELLSHHFLSVFFFHTLLQPVPKIPTGHVRDDYYKYFSRTNPLRLFSKHTHIEYSHVYITETRLQEILESWWENNKTRIEYKFTNSSFSKWLNKIDYFAKYRRDDKYFMKICFENKLYS